MSTPTTESSEITPVMVEVPVAELHRLATEILEARMDANEVFILLEGKVGGKAARSALDRIKEAHHIVRRLGGEPDLPEEFVETLDTLDELRAERLAADATQLFKEVRDEDA